MAKLDGLEPKIVWSTFEEITKIPRCSGKEKGIQTWLEQWAHVNGLDFKKDEVGNILITRRATTGCEGNPVLVLQSHQDMVCEKNSDSAHNFETDEIPIKLDGNTVKSEGTSLGADNGIGLAISLAMLIDTSLKRHGKIEALTTVEEETGLKGALNMKPGFFTGKYMINLDSEEAGVVIIGSAGGSGTQYNFLFTQEPMVGWTGYRVEINGLLGGHSGVDIHLPRANANKLIADFLAHLRKKTLVRLVQIEGGTRGNAIPRSASCNLIIPSSYVDKIDDIFATWTARVKTKYPAEAGISVTLSVNPASTALTTDQTDSIIGLINGVHNGVFSWSKSIEGLVETSNNLGVITTMNNSIKINILSRSSDIEDLRKDLKILSDVGIKYSAEVTQSPPSQGWKADVNSPLLKTVASIYESVRGEKPKVTAVHGGLECGHFTRLNPGLSVLSIGPTIKYPHSPQEYVYIDSVNIVWAVVRKLAEKMCNESK